MQDDCVKYRGLMEFYSIRICVYKTFKLFFIAMGQKRY